MHIAMVAEMFPSLEFHLVDPAKFNIALRYGTFTTIADRIFTTQKEFTDDMAAKWADRGDDVLFISDIRSGSTDQGGFEDEVSQNMEMQMRWREIMDPVAALFKFRPPYTDGISAAKYPYPDGELLLQPFAPNNSTEGRLLMWRGAKNTQLRPNCLRKLLFLAQQYSWEWGMFDHGIDTKLVDGLCGCFDCARAVQIMQEYADQYGGNVVYLMNRMVKATSQVLSTEQHGFRPDVLPSDKWIDAAQKFGESWQHTMCGRRQYSMLYQKHSLTCAHHQKNSRNKSWAR